MLRKRGSLIARRARTESGFLSNPKSVSAALIEHSGAHQKPLELKDAASRICTTRMTLQNPWVSPIAAIAKRARLHQRYVGNILRCRFTAPDIIEVF
jgi:hypothetical protein